MRVQAQGERVSLVSRSCDREAPLPPTSPCAPGGLWVVVLAAGEGTRLASITAGADGVAIPKQFCSVDGRRSLLRTTLDRAEGLTTDSRIMSVVAARHARWWRDELAHLPPSNVLVQPASRGTAAGVLLPVLSILRRDPRGMVVVLPSDHHVADEAVLQHELLAAVRNSRAHDGRPVLLGIEADAAETGYGWIVPARGAQGRCAPVVSFVEKPGPEVAGRLWREGALWSSFMFTASAESLVHMVERTLPGLLRDFRRAMDRSVRPHRSDWLTDFYADLPSHDFSRDVLQACGGAHVLSVPPCGWSDLGTPERLAAVPGLRGPLVERARAWTRQCASHPATVAARRDTR